MSLLFNMNTPPYPHTLTTPLQVFVNMSPVSDSLSIFPIALTPIRILKLLYSDKKCVMDELPTVKTSS